MNKFFKYSLTLMVGVFGLASCSSSSDDYQKGTWDAAEGFASIYFEKASESIELDPVEATVYTAKLNRRNTENATTVKFEVTTNTDDVFTVSDAVFAAGESEADVTISFPNAEVGKPYTLSITSTDPEFVSPKYSNDITYTLTVNRVKWNDVGFYYDEDGNKVEGYAMFTDDIITGFYGVINCKYPVRIQERDDLKGYFRVINLYEDYLYNHDYDADPTHYLYIDATNPAKVYIPSLFESGMDLGSGHVLVHSIAGLRISQGRADELTDADYGTYENGKITFAKEGLLIGEVDYNDGGLYRTNGSGLTSFVINPDLDLHNADMTSDEDFTWEEVYAGIFASGKLGTKTDGVKLYKGTCINTEKECDKRFAEEYGTAYMIESPYANGYNLYFAVNERGEVTLPEDLKLQDTGTKAVGEEVYAAISAAASTFTERVVTLKIAFQTKPDEDGNFIEYGSAEEVLSYITWTAVGTGTYTYDFYAWWYSDEDAETYDPIVDPGYTISQRDDDESIYKIEDWTDGGELTFKWDKETNDCVVYESETGMMLGSYGMVYASDVAEYTGNAAYYESYPCSYDPDTKTFNFQLIYYISSQNLGVFEESFEVDWSASAASSKRLVTKKASKTTKTLKNLTSPKKVKGLTKMNKSSRFGTGKKVNIKTKKVLSSAQLVK